MKIEYYKSPLSGVIYRLIDEVRLEAYSHKHHKWFEQNTNSATAKYIHCMNALYQPITKRQAFMEII